MKTLAEIIRKIPVASVIGNMDIPILAVSFDSRNVEPGTLFVAIRGTVSDGHEYIPDVVRRGVSAVVCEETPASIRQDITYIITRDSALALGLICAEFYDHPSHKLTLVGVTGTNGKTTTATLLYHLFRKMGYKAGLISTVAYYVDGQRSEATHTTPDPVQLNKLMAQMVRQGATEQTDGADGTAGLRILFYGGEFARGGAATYCGIAFCGWRFHQPHARPFRFPQNLCRIPESEENVF